MKAFSRISSANTEVKSMLLTEFDEVAYREMLLDEGREEGMKKGRTEGRLSEIVKSISEGDYSIERGAEKAAMTVIELREYAKETFGLDI